ncbi:MAG: site-specific integrase [Oscillospiraceae bacterium]|nr:site-specific integrase [Oscillospiraceae bacterium]
MANIKKVEGKNGTSYQITVTTGRDGSGKQKRHWKTWRPPEKMTERQIEKAVQKLAADFEREIEQGFAADNRQSFDEYAQYVFGLKTTEGAKYKTIEAYQNLMQRISPAIGYMKLKDIRPQHLNKFYSQLSVPGQRATEGKATAKTDLHSKIKALGLSHKTFAEQAGLSAATVDAACRGQTVSESSARKISSLFDEKPDVLFYIERNAAPLSNKTILEYHRCIHAVLEQAAKEMLVPYNAADKATPPKVSRHEVNYFQPSQVSDILDALEEEPIKWRLFTHLLIVTGCRRGEIAGLKWKNVDLKAGTIRIDCTLLYARDRGIYENATKTGDIRNLKIPQETISLLKEYRRWWIELRFKNGDRWAGTDYLFVQDDGKAIDPNSVTRWLARFSERHGLPHINPHAFRHTAASAMTQRKLDPVTVSKRLGHSRVSTTMDIYAHLFAEADAEASETIADVLLRAK